MVFVILFCSSLEIIKKHVVSGLAGVLVRIFPVAEIFLVPDFCGYLLLTYYVKHEDYKFVFFFFFVGNKNKSR